MKPVIVLAAIQQCIAQLVDIHQLAKNSDAIKGEYPDLFQPILHLSQLPTDIYCCIQLKDANKQIQTCSYQMPCWYNITKRGKFL